MNSWWRFLFSYFFIIYVLIHRIESKKSSKRRWKLTLFNFIPNFIHTRLVSQLGVIYVACQFLEMLFPLFAHSLVFSRLVFSFFFFFVCLFNNVTCQFWEEKNSFYARLFIYVIYKSLNYTIDLPTVCSVRKLLLFDVPWDHHTWRKEIWEPIAMFS